MGVIVVVLDEVRKRVLLHKREDFRLWALPGGAVEPGETTSQAAIRETQEETGYDVVITRLVGEYSRPQYKDMMYVFEGSVVGVKPSNPARKRRRLRGLILRTSLPVWLPQRRSILPIQSQIIRVPLNVIFISHCGLSSHEKSLCFYEMSVIGFVLK